VPRATTSTRRQKTNRCRSFRPLPSVSFIYPPDFPRSRFAFGFLPPSPREARSDIVQQVSRSHASNRNRADSTASHLRSAHRGSSRLVQGRIRVWIPWEAARGAVTAIGVTSMRGLPPCFVLHSSPAIADMDVESQPAAAACRRRPGWALDPTTFPETAALPYPFFGLPRSSDPARRLRQPRLECFPLPLHCCDEGLRTVPFAFSTPLNPDSERQA